MNLTFALFITAARAKKNSLFNKSNVYNKLLHILIMLEAYIHSYIESCLFPTGLGRNHFVPLPTIQTISFASSTFIKLFRRVRRFRILLTWPTKTRTIWSRNVYLYQDLILPTHTFTLINGI